MTQQKKKDTSSSLKISKSKNGYITKDGLKVEFYDDLKMWKTKKAFEKMDELRKENPISMTTEEIIAAKNYGRK